MDRSIAPDSAGRFALTIAIRIAVSAALSVIIFSVFQALIIATHHGGFRESYRF